MCERGLQSQCETTQNYSQGKGAALFGYTKLYGHVPGGQAEYLRVPQAQYGPINGDPVQWTAQQLAGMLPPSLAEPIAKNFSVDRLNALISSFYGVRRGGTVSLSGVYGGALDPLPMVDMFDRQLTIRMGRCNIKR